uniref:hypothetical protein n=1 Tax=Oceaniglobus trochenteri TaxID=2763260 RepID=UPI00247AD56D
REQAEQKHKAEAESLRAERDKARAERDSAKQGREQAEQKHKAEVESLRAEHDGEKTAHEEALQAQRGEIDRLTGERDAALTENADLNAALLRLTTRNQALQADLETRFHELADITRRAETLDHDAATLRADMAALAATHAETVQAQRDEIDRLTGERDTALAENADLNAARHDLQATLLRRTAQTQALQADLETRFRELADITRRAEALDRDAAAHEQAVLAQQSEIDRLTGERDAALAENADLNAARRDLQAALLRQTADKDLLQADIAIRFRELADITRRAETLEARNTELQTRLSAALRGGPDNQQKTAPDDSATWPRERDLMQREIEQTKAIYDNAIADVAQRLTARDKKVREMSATLREVKQTLATTQGELSRVGKERDALQAHVEELHNSSSWKLTRPLRGIRGKMGK